MDSRERLAWNVRKLRVAARISQEELAVDAAIDRTYISGIERGTHNPSLAVVDRLALAFGVDVTILLTEPKGDEPIPLPMPSGRRARRH